MSIRRFLGIDRPSAPPIDRQQRYSDWRTTCVSNSRRRNADGWAGAAKCSNPSLAQRAGYGLLATIWQVAGAAAV